MKLHQTVTEGFVPVPVQLSLSEIVRAGKVTNPYHIFLLAWVSEFFKNGVQPLASLEVPITAGSLATSTVVVDSIKSLTPEDQVALASYLLTCIEAGESALKQPSAVTSDWIQFVLRKQD